LFLTEHILFVLRVGFLFWFVLWVVFDCGLWCVSAWFVVYFNVGWGVGFLAMELGKAYYFVSVH